jgi:hypothetical protein
LEVTWGKKRWALSLYCWRVGVIHPVVILLLALAYVEEELVILQAE